MIRSLRKRHQKYAVVLVILPLSVLGIGLAVRPAETGLTQLPSKLIGPDIESLTTVRPLGKPWLNLPVEAHLCQTPNGQLGLKLSIIDELLKPDLLVYWIPESSNQTPDIREESRLPSNSVFLGSFAQTAPSFLPIPESAQTTGRLILYSLPYQEIVDQSKSLSLVE